MHGMCPAVSRPPLLRSKEGRQVRCRPTQGTGAGLQTEMMFWTGLRHQPPPQGLPGQVRSEVCMVPIARIHHDMYPSAQIQSLLHFPWSGGLTFTAQ